jgi:hypothetical protein
MLFSDSYRPPGRTDVSKFPTTLGQRSTAFRSTRQAYRKPSDRFCKTIFISKCLRGCAFSKTLAAFQGGNRSSGSAPVSTDQYSLIAWPTATLPNLTLAVGTFGRATRFLPGRRGAHLGAASSNVLPDCQSLSFQSTVPMNPPEGSAVAFPADSVAVDTSERQDTDPPRQKRKRISHACQACRQRKSRCDGARPVCQLCSQNGLVCQYSEAAQPPRAASPDRRTVTNLERRLHDMEATVRALVASQTNMQPMHDGSFCPSRASDPLSVHGLHNRRSSITHVGSAPLGATSQQASGLANSHDNVDGMVSVTFSDEKSSGTFGMSVFADQHHRVSDLMSRRSDIQHWFLGGYPQCPSYRF